ncbi:unnamed protein product [Rotaria sordida]|uniref:F-box domain-containing protein n=1 Tax=Rotaria sordida TaxID=392033 RepID=A0A814DGI5_9BILA|nr:unnamed protein product [Rotaria sordida]
MNQVKRQLNEHVPFDEKAKKLRNLTFHKNDIEVTCIEYLSNEIFYEIFDYLDGCDIFDIFSKLNIRFKRLILYSSLPIKIYRSISSNQITEYHYQKFIIPHRHRIISFHIHDESYMSSSFSLHMIDASFNRLESLVLYRIQYNILILFLPDLSTLPRLFSLKIDLYDGLRNFSELYGLIFRLPLLKYNKISAFRIFSPILQPYITDEYSPIEHLVIDHECVIHELVTILSCTPRLSHLTCKCLNSNSSIKREIPRNISNLRYLSINVCYLQFDEFETFIKKSFPHIRVLRFVSRWDSSYLDANRWEQLILKHIPYLRILNFKYNEGIYNQLTLNPYHLNLNRFLSPVWIQRRWFLELKICINTFLPATITYSIQPLKKQWYEWHNEANSNEIIIYPTLTEQKCINTSFSQLHLTLEGPQSVEYYRSVQEYICSIATLVQFTSLHIDLCYFSISILLQLLNILPNLDSLTITSGLPEKTKILSKEQINMFRSVSSHNKITKVNLEQITELDQIHILMDLCFHMCDLQVKCRNIFDGKWLVRYVLNKRNTNFIPYLCSICLWISEANNEMMNNLQIIIDTEKLIDNYTIKRICDKIYLRWNEHL